MKDFFMGMAVGAAIAGAMCCPKTQEMLKKAEQKIKEVAGEMKSKKNEGSSQPQQSSGSCCECGCDSSCPEEDLY